MSSDLVSLIAGVTSVVALIISILNAVIAKKRLITETITNNRIEWINEVRSILRHFLSLYNTSNTNREDMRSLFHQMQLFMNRYNSYYTSLFKAARCCLNDETYCDEHAERFILASQEVFCYTWAKMKREAGIEARNEKKVNKMLHYEFKDLEILNYNEKPF